MSNSMSSATSWILLWPLLVDGLWWQTTDRYSFVGNVHFWMSAFSVVNCTYVVNLVTLPQAICKTSPAKAQKQLQIQSHSTMSVGKLCQVTDAAKKIHHRFNDNLEKGSVDHSLHTTLLNLRHDAPDFGLRRLQTDWSYDWPDVSCGDLSTLAIIKQHERLLEFCSRETQTMGDFNFR